MDRWRKDGDAVVLRSVARGQEFVLDCDCYPEVLAWVTPCLPWPSVDGRIVTMLLGIDCAVDPRKTGLALAEIDDGVVKVSRLAVGSRLRLPAQSSSTGSKVR